MTAVRRLVSQLRRHAEWWWVPLLMIGVVLFLYRTIWWAEGGKPQQWFGWDCPESYWPDIAYYANALGHGDWPLWNPYDRGGYAFYGDTVTGLYYPVTWAFVLPGAALGAMPAWTIQVKALLHWALAGMLVHAFLRTRRLPAAAAAFGGVVFIVSVPMIIHKASAQAWPMIWAPLIWIATDRAIEHAREAGWWRRAVALGGAIGLAGAAGPPPGFFYILLMCLAYGLLRLVQTLRDAHRAGRLRPEALAQTKVLAVAGVLTSALLAVVVLPGLAVAAESATRGAARNLAYSLNTALPPARTLQGMIAPWAGIVDVYLGLAVVALAFVAIVARPRADRWVPVLFLAIGVVALLLAFGGATPLLPWLVEHVPGFGFFREPNRYKLVTAMALAVVAAHGLAALLEEDPLRRRRARLALAGVLVALGAALLVVKGVSSAKPVVGMPGFGTSLTMFGVAAALLLGLSAAPVRYQGALVAALLGLCWWDVASFGSGFLNTREAPTDDQEDRRFLAGLGDVEREWRVYDEFVMEQRPGSRLRIRDLRGYPSGDPFDDARYAEVRARLRKQPELAAAFNVRWVLHGPHHRNGKGKNHIQQPPDRTTPARFRKLDDRRFEVIDPAPLIAWYGAATIVPGKAQALDAVAAQERTPAARLRAIVEKADVPASERAGIEALAASDAAAVPPAPVAGRLLVFEANRVRIAVDAPAAGVAVLNEKMLIGWQATVDGRPAHGFRTNFMLRGVVVPAGEHVIEWTFHPPRYGIYITLWLLGLATLLAAGISALRARRRMLGSQPS